MPSKSRAQHNLMEMMAHNPSASKKGKVSKKVAAEFVKADKGKDISKLPRRVKKGKK